MAKPLFPQTGTLTMFDRLGRPIQPGQIILFNNAVDLMAVVTAVGPVVHPNAPAGLMQIKIHVEDFTISIPGGQPQERIVIIGSRNTPGAESDPPPPNGLIQ